MIHDIMGARVERDLYGDDGDGEQGECEGLRVADAKSGELLDLEAGEGGVGGREAVEGGALEPRAALPQLRFARRLPAHRHRARDLDGARVGVRVGPSSRIGGCVSSR